MRLLWKAVGWMVVLQQQQPGRVHNHGGAVATKTGRCLKYQRPRKVCPGLDLDIQYILWIYSIVAGYQIIEYKPGKMLEEDQNCEFGSETTVLLTEACLAGACRPRYAPVKATPKYTQSRIILIFIAFNHGGDGQL